MTNMYVPATAAVKPRHTELTLTQRPDHVVKVGETVMIDGDPFTVLSVKPVRESGVFLDWNQGVESNVVIVAIERFDGYPS